MCRENLTTDQRRTLAHQEIMDIIISAEHRQLEVQKEFERYRRDMRIVNSIMLLCAAALIVLLAIQIIS